MSTPILSAEGLNSERWDTIKRDITKRLRRICAALPDADFILLVDSMVATQMKGEHRKNRALGPH
ncbi:MAG: hypothetical protein ABI408_13125 [Gemmatimonadaceae bacterium]